MQIGHIEGAEATIGRSQGYAGLPIRAEIVTDPAKNAPAPAFTSAWFPSPDELERLNAGAAVHVRCLYSQPPINVTVGEAPA